MGYKTLVVQINAVNFCRLQSSRKPGEENDHDTPHQDGVKDIHCPLMREEVCILAHDIFNDTEDRPNDNKNAAGIEHVHHLSPRYEYLVSRLWYQVLVHSVVEHSGTNNEEPENEQLDEEPANDHVLAHVAIF